MSVESNTLTVTPELPSVTVPVTVGVGFLVGGSVSTVTPGLTVLMVNAFDALAVVLEPLFPALSVAVAVTLYVPLASAWGYVPLGCTRDMSSIQVVLVLG